MVFSSLTFLAFFLPLVLACYFICSNARHRNAVLLVFSLVFYAWGEPKWIFVMLLTVTTNYLSGKLINIARTKAGRFFGMLFGVATGLGFLIYFKYCGFILDNFKALTGIETAFKAPVLPIGISFYTFQVLTYTIDVYRGKVKVQRNFFDLLLYVSFFPQLIAGPIVNYKDIERQLQKRTITLDGFYDGFIRFCLGLAKKVLLANNCGQIVDNLQKAGVSSVGGAWLLAIAFALQLYFDFSGYSSMAIGLGKMFGFEFLENFNFPYAADSITDFWRRWHISLGSFFREYVYIPLGGNRVGVFRNILNILIVWALTGIWHGASWNFMLWGVYYGILLIIEKFLLKKVKAAMPKAVNIIVTLFFVLIGWCLFYFTDMSQAMTQISHMFGIGSSGLFDSTSLYYVKRNLGLLIISVLTCIPWPSILKTDKETGFVKFLNVIKPIVATAFLLLSICALVGQSYNPFLYFRF